MSVKLRPVVTIVGWVVVAAFLGSIGWTAVQVIVDDVGGGQATMLSSSDITNLLPAASDSVGSALPGFQGSSPATTSPTAGSPSASTSVGGTPGPASTAKGGPAAPTSTPTTTRKPQTSPTAGVGRTATFTTVGGSVAATCRQSTISLNYARPNDGWQVNVGNRGPEEIEVKFRSTRAAVVGKAADSSTENEIQLKCLAGVPVRN